MNEIKMLRQFYIKGADIANQFTQKNGLTNDWSAIDSPRSAFDTRFRDLYPKEFPTLQDYIEQTFVHKKGRLRGLEIGGPGSALFRGFTPGFFARTAGVCLVDSREEFEKQDDNARSHKVIPIDLKTPESVQAAKDWLGEVDVLFEYMNAGQYCLPNNPFFMGEKAVNWLTLLSEDSAVFAQVPDAFSRWGVKNNDSAHAWTTYVNAHCPQVNVTLVNDNMCLRKLPGSPKVLPLLPAIIVLAQELQIARLRRSRYH